MVGVCAIIVLFNPPQHPNSPLNFVTACTPAPGWEPWTTKQLTEAAGIVVLGQINHTWVSGDGTVGTVARVEVQCAFSPYKLMFWSGNEIPGSPRVGPDKAQLVNIAGFGNAAECRSHVTVGQQYLLFLHNVSETPAWGGYEVAARYDDIYGAARAVSLANIAGVMEVTAPEGNDCAEFAGVGWDGHCVSEGRRVENGWTGKGFGDDNYCQVCSCWDSFFFCSNAPGIRRGETCPPRSSASTLHTPAVSRFRALWRRVGQTRGSHGGIGAVDMVYHMASLALASTLLNALAAVVTVGAVLHRM